jgi:hypothetical protein
MMYDGSRFLFMGLFFCLLIGTSCYSDHSVEELIDRFQAGYQTAFATDPQGLLHFSAVPARLDSISKFQELLETVDTHYLSRRGKDQRLELEATLQQEWRHWEPYRVNPALYNLGGLLKKELVRSAGDPPAVRLERLGAILEQADGYYAAARQNLVVTDVSLYRLAAQKQYLGLEFLQKEWADSLAVFPVSPAERQALREKTRRTTLALKDFMGFCESVYLNYRDSTFYTKLGSSPEKVKALQ